MDALAVEAAAGEDEEDDGEEEGAEETVDGVTDIKSSSHIDVFFFADEDGAGREKVGRCRLTLDG